MIAQRIFVILKDPRVGTFGALALVIFVTFRLVLLAQLGGIASATLLLTHCLSRLGPVWLMVAMPYVSGAAAKSRQVTRAGAAQGVLAATVGAASAGGMVAGGAIGASAALAAFAVMALFTALCGWAVPHAGGGRSR